MRIGPAWGWVTEKLGGDSQVDIVLVFLEPEDFAVVEGQGPIRFVPDLDRGILFTFAQKGMGEDDFAREYSLAATKHVRSQWMHVGQFVA